MTQVGLQNYFAIRTLDAVEVVVVRDLSLCFFVGVLIFLDTAFLAAFFGEAFLGETAFFGESLLSYELSVTTPLSVEVDIGLLFLRGGPPPFDLSL